MTDHGAILFTAFEPSGDDHAAAVIAQLRARRPSLTIYALGGPKMEAAGARLIESTTERAHMLTGALSQVQVHRERLARLSKWLEQHHIRLHVPVDSPAANWSICASVRKHMPGARIVHLVAPQMWAWAPWRIGKMRRLSDMVLCLLPFEENWFASRGVEARFIGHPLFDPDHHRPAENRPTLPEAPLRLALLPGSRRQEIKGNWPAMIDAFAHARATHPQLVGVVAARNEETRSWIEDVTEAHIGSRSLPEGMQFCTGRADDVLEWSNAVVVTSGTASLQVAAHNRPMVIVYRASRLFWYSISWWLLRTQTFGLPNVIAEKQGWGRIVPELVPFFGNSAQLAREVLAMLNSPEARAKQQANLQRVAGLFEGKRYSYEAATHLLKVLGDEGAG